MSEMTISAQEKSISDNVISMIEQTGRDILHPVINEKAPVGLLPHIQVLLLARHLQGDLDGYPPFIWK